MHEDATLPFQRLVRQAREHAQTMWRVSLAVAPGARLRRAAATRLARGRAQRRLPDFATGHAVGRPQVLRSLAQHEALPAVHEARLGECASIGPHLRGPTVPRNFTVTWDCWSWIKNKEGVLQSLDWYDRSHQ